MLFCYFSWLSCTCSLFWPISHNSTTLLLSLSSTTLYGELVSLSSPWSSLSSLSEERVGSESPISLLKFPMLQTPLSCGYSGSFFGQICSKCLMLLKQRLRQLTRNQWRQRCNSWECIRAYFISSHGFPQLSTWPLPTWLSTRDIGGLPSSPCAQATWLPTSGVAWALDRDRVTERSNTVLSTV